MPALRRDEVADQRAVGRGVRPIGDVVLHLVPSLVHGVGALAEAQEPLTRLGIEPHADRGHTRSRSRHRCAQRDHAVAARVDSHLDPPGRVRGLELRDVGATLHPARCDPRRMEPAGGRAESEGSRGAGPEAPVLAQDEMTGSVRGRQMPRIRVGTDPEVARAHLCRGSGSADQQRGEDEEGGGQLRAPPSHHERVSRRRRRGGS
jgi:hypothetical protein